MQKSFGWALYEGARYRPENMVNPICNKGNLGSWRSVYTQLCHKVIFCIDSVLKRCATNRKKQLSALPDVSPYIYDVKSSGFTRSSIYIRH
jgi:hypothetical protein